MFNDTIIILDINECEKKSHNCHSNAKCINTDGSFTCQCKGGYEGDGFICNSQHSSRVSAGKYFIIYSRKTAQNTAIERLIHLTQG